MAVWPCTPRPRVTFPLQRKRHQRLPLTESQDFLLQRDATTSFTANCVTQPRLYLLQCRR